MLATMDLDVTDSTASSTPAAARRTGGSSATGAAPSAGFQMRDRLFKKIVLSCPCMQNKSCFVPAVTRKLLSLLSSQPLDHRHSNNSSNNNNIIMFMNNLTEESARRTESSWRRWSSTST